MKGLQSIDRTPNQYFTVYIPISPVDIRRRKCNVQIKYQKMTPGSSPKKTKKRAKNIGL